MKCSTIRLFGEGSGDVERSRLEGQVEQWREGLEAERVRLFVDWEFREGEGLRRMGVAGGGGGTIKSKSNSLDQIWG